MRPGAGADLCAPGREQVKAWPDAVTTALRLGDSGRVETAVAECGQALDEEGVLQKQQLAYILAQQVRCPILTICFSVRRPACALTPVTFGWPACGLQSQLPHRNVCKFATPVKAGQITDAASAACASTSPSSPRLCVELHPALTTPAGIRASL